MRLLSMYFSMASMRYFLISPSILWSFECLNLLFLWGGEPNWMDIPLVLPTLSIYPEWSGDIYFIQCILPLPIGDHITSYCSRDFCPEKEPLIALWMLADDQNLIGPILLPSRVLFEASDVRPAGPGNEKLPSVLILTRPHIMCTQFLLLISFSHKV